MPDFCNAMLTDFMAARAHLGRREARYADNLARYYEECREADWCLTHTLVDPQVDRSKGPGEQSDPFTALRLVRETDAGLVVRGAKMLSTLAPFANELFVGPFYPRQPGEEPYALTFALPMSTPGLKFICRETYDGGRSDFDRPLSSQYDEEDALAVFDDVLVPWERVFLLGDVDLLNRTANVTHSSAHSAHQGAVKNLAKAEFVLGVALLMTQTLGNSQLPNVEERIGELMLYAQLTRACMRAAEADAELDEWGVMCPDLLMVESPRNLFMTAYPRMIEILQLLGSSSFMLTPTEADMKGPLGPAIEQYLATDNSPAKDRIKLFRLAWDIAGTSFGSRQVLYERFFASDPLTRARALASIYPKKEVMDRVLEFLGRDDDVE